MRLTDKQRLERIKQLKGLSKKDKEFLDDLLSYKDSYLELRQREIEDSLMEDHYKGLIY